MKIILFVEIHCGFVREAWEGVENLPMNKSYLIDSDIKRQKKEVISKSLPLCKQEVGNRWSSQCWSLMVATAKSFNKSEIYRWSQLKNAFDFK